MDYQRFTNRSDANPRGDHMTRRSDRPAGRPRRRKKKQADKSGRRYLILGAAAGAVALVALAVVAVVVIRPRFTPPKVTAPEQYEVFNSPEDVFHVSLPKGWKLESGGLKHQYRVTAEKGTATIQVYESLTGSLLGDIAEAGNRDMKVPDELLAVSRVHEAKRQTVAEGYSDYREQPAVMVETQFGKVRRSTFTAKAGLGGKVRGYRATALGAMTSIAVVCTCPPEDWDTLEPAFARVIASIGPGAGGG
jgi:hypothetical protein